MFQTIKVASKGIIFVAFAIVLVILVPFIFIKGATWVSIRILPWFQVASFITFLVCLFILLPLSFMQKTRRFSVVAFLITSYIFAITTWTWSLLLTYMLWGGVAVFIGLFLFGVGVFPIALLATMFNGMWSAFFQIIILFLLTWGIRFYSFSVEEKANRADEERYIRTVQYED
ncbi:hypothetical protein ACIQW9_13035 [Herminiimonas sp. NPDC097707]|uniref:hypothetical protein n=1 Tax=Herminiimonas sp. NPDC097707 TaxID=3364007 RepID=UPI00383BC4DE